MSITSFHPYSHHPRWILLSSFYRCGNWGSQDLLVTQWVSGRAGFKPRALYYKFHLFSPVTPLLCTAREVDIYLFISKLILSVETIDPKMGMYSWINYRNDTFCGVYPRHCDIKWECWPPSWEESDQVKNSLLLPFFSKTGSIDTILDYLKAIINLEGILDCF